MTQGSELAVVSAEIVDILPREYQTPEMQQWVKDSLTQGNSPSELLEYCKNAFGVVASKIEACESRIERQGFRLDAHIKYTDEKFAAVNSELSELKQKIAVTEAVNNERASMNQFMLNGVMQAQNATNQSVANVATKSNKSMIYPDPTYWLIGAIIVFGLFTFVKVQVDKPTQNQQQPKAESTAWDCSPPKKNLDGTTQFTSCSKNRGEI